MFIPPSDELLAVLPVDDKSDYEALHTYNADQEFITAWNYKAHQAHQNAKNKGFWENDRNDGEMIALIHSELSEALEALRHGNPHDDKIPQFSGAEAELADVLIRVMDMSHARGWRVAEAIIAKMAMNTTREPKHGKEF